MSNLKRFLALTLVVVMVIAGAVPAFAAFKDVPATDPVNSQMKVLSDFGIVKGTGVDEEGNQLFSPDEKVTRAQMAMFLARTHSGIPQFFVPDSTVSTAFLDCTDPTYYTAINYCVGINAINGRTATSYDPDGIVTLQEAAKMMVFGLGYVGIEYPIGTLAKALDLKLLDGIKDLTANRPLTRRDVAIMLYNLLMEGTTVDLKVYINPISGLQESRDNGVTIISKHGFDKRESYIVSTATFAMNYTTLDITGKAVTFSKNPDSAPGTILNPTKFDMTVGYVDAAGAAAYSQYTKAELGLADRTDEAILGLKVILYIPNGKNTNNAKVPARVVGTKKDVSKAANDATYTLDANGIELKKDTGVKITIDGVDYGDGIKNVDGKNSDGSTKELFKYLYLWNGTRVLKAEVGKGVLGVDNLNETANPERTLAKMIKNKGAYKLEVIDNGTIKGTNQPEIVFVFEPYSVMPCNVNGTNYRIGVGSDRDIPQARFSVNALNGTVFTPASDAIYLVSFRSDIKYTSTKYPIDYNSSNDTTKTIYLNVYEKLTKSVSGAKNVYAFDKTAVFMSGTSQITKTFDAVTGSKAIYANYYAYNSLLAAKFNNTATYDLYTDASGMVIYTKETGATTYFTKNYAVVLAATSTYPLWSGTALTMLEVANVMKYGATTAENLLINRIDNASVVDAGTACVIDTVNGVTDNIVVKGDVIQYEASDYVSVTTLRNNQKTFESGGNIKTDTGFINVKDKGFYSTSIGQISYTQNSDLMTANSGNFTTALASSARVMVYNKAANKAVSISIDSLKKLILTEPATLAYVDDYLFVKNVNSYDSYGPLTYVYVGFNASLLETDAIWTKIANSTTIAVENPYYIVSNKRSSYGSAGILTSDTSSSTPKFYETRYAYNIKTGAAIIVVATDNTPAQQTATLAEGNVVKLTGKKLSGSYDNEGTIVTVTAEVVETAGTGAYSTYVRNMSMTDLMKKLKDKTSSDSDELAEYKGIIADYGLVAYKKGQYVIVGGSTSSNVAYSATATSRLTVATTNEILVNAADTTKTVADILFNANISGMTIVSETVDYLATDMSTAMDRYVRTDKGGTALTSGSTFTVYFAIVSNDSANGNVNADNIVIVKVPCKVI